MALVICLCLLALFWIGWSRLERWLADRILAPNPWSDTARYQIAFAGSVLSCTYPDGRERRLPLGEVASVRIETNDSGPVGIDVVWIFDCSSGGAPLWVPNGASGWDALFSALHQLPGFGLESNLAIAEAMGSTDNREFLCWTR